jgi:hypothetical protein
MAFLMRKISLPALEALVRGMDRGLLAAAVVVFSRATSPAGCSGTSS